MIMSCAALLCCALSLPLESVAVGNEDGGIVAADEGRIEDLEAQPIIIALKAKKIAKVIALAALPKIILAKKLSTFVAAGAAGALAAGTGGREESGESYEYQPAYGYQPTYEYQPASSY